MLEIPRRRSAYQIRKPLDNAAKLWPSIETLYRGRLETEMHDPHYYSDVLLEQIVAMTARHTNSGGVA